MNAAILRSPSGFSAVVWSLLIAGCSSGSTTGGEDASPPAIDLSTVDAAIPQLTACPTQGTGAILAPAGCVVFTPQQAGADPSGVNATQYQIALEPAGVAKGVLVVHLNGSLGSPAGQIADPQKNLYSALSAAGFHVIGVAYRSNAIVGVLCNGSPSCFAPTRRTLVLGSYVAGAPSSLANTRADEGIVQRLDAALSLLTAARPSGGWAQYQANLSAPDILGHIAWNKVIASGHSQGGGHAAFLGSVAALRRVVQLSSTCDYTSGVAAPWTSAALAWATVPKTGFVGFAAPTTFTSGNPTAGDTTCPYHVAVWQNMGMDAANQHDDAAACGASGDTHSASIACTDNFARWPTLYQ
jgi:hypothetical protein